MKVGSFGKVTFTVSPKKIRTIENLEITRSANYTEHKLHHRLGRLEFTGRNLAKASFPITLSAFLGVNPTKELAKLERMWKKYEAAYLILGDKPIGKKWVITELKNKYTYFDRNGDVLSIDVTVSLMEYN